MKLPDDPKLPFNVPDLRLGVTTWMRRAAVAVNGLLDKTDTPVDPASPVTVGPSPFAFAHAVYDGLLVVSGGTVSAIDYSRQGAFTSLGITSGLIPVKAGDSVRITYTVAPTVTFIRQ